MSGGVGDGFDDGAGTGLCALDVALEDRVLDRL